MHILFPVFPYKAYVLVLFFTVIRYVHISSLHVEPYGKMESSIASSDKSLSFFTPNSLAAAVRATATDTSPLATDGLYRAFTPGSMPPTTPVQCVTR